MTPQVYYNMIAPDTFKFASDTSTRHVCNGCGTKGWMGLLVPDEINNIDISLA